MTGGVRRVAKVRSTGRLCMRAMPLTVLAPATGHAYAMRRFFARGIDLSLYFLIVLTFGGIVLPETFARIDSPLSLLSAYVVAVASFPAVEGQFVSFFRNTPGKALFGLRVVTGSGHAPTSSQIAGRSHDALSEGLTPLLPVVSLFTLPRLYRRLVRGEGAPWDASGAFSVVTTRPPGHVVAAVTLALCVVVTLCSMSTWAQATSWDGGRPLQFRDVLNRWWEGFDSKTSRWVNPVTGAEQRLPDGWEVLKVERDNVLDEFATEFVWGEHDRIVLRAFRIDPMLSPEQGPTDADLKYFLRSLGDLAESSAPDFNKEKVGGQVLYRAGFRYFADERELQVVVNVWRSGQYYWAMAVEIGEDPSNAVYAMALAASLRHGTWHVDR